ncbi:hypothetical protein ACIGO8_33365 [Streptomyces sp. NPDC053493]|uniref:hypothetical protein n=1 Tax=Streptomyces sp. NPDC053493 TaxID=3365705 RepID=UPI0037D73974
MARTSFPPDLVTAQTCWIAVYEQLARTGPARTTALRRRLIRLSAEVYFHPYWARSAAGGRAELLRAARTVQAHREVTAA